MTPTFVQSFSQGQITIPKKFRDELNLDSVFWLKLFIDDKKRIIAEPQITNINNADYAKKLLKLKTDWFDFKEWQETRKKTNEAINRHLDNY